MDVSAKIIVIIASDSAKFCESNVEVPCYSITVGTFRGLTCAHLKLEIAQKSQYPSKEDSVKRFWCYGSSMFIYSYDVLFKSSTSCLAN